MTEPTYPVYMTDRAWGEVAGFLAGAADAGKAGAMTLAAQDMHGQVTEAIQEGLS